MNNLNELQEALNLIAKNIYPKGNIEIGKAIEKIQHLITICTQSNTIKYDLDHISDILGNCYDTDDNGKLVKSEWNDDVEQANQEIYDIKQAYSWRLLDTKVLNEIKEIVGIHNDTGLKNRINELLKKEQELQGYKEREQYEYEEWQDRQ